VDDLLSSTQHLSKASATDGDISALEQFVGGPLPRTYLTLLREHDGAEGWIGNSYVAFWPAVEVPLDNETIDAATHVPGLLLFGTDGGGEAYGFDRTQNWRILRVPLVGLSLDLAIREGDDLVSWIRSLAKDVPSPPPQSRVAAPRMNLYEITPVIAGGDPTDPDNKAWVTFPQLLAIAKWWNERLRRVERE
jgi:hypothetical protein